MTSRNEELFERARKHIPGGVNSPVRAFRSVGGTPLFFRKGAGARVQDADGKWYVDYVGSWGPMILGHAHPAVVEAVRETRARGGRVVAVGTTSVRSLESAAARGTLESGTGDTTIFIYPGYRFRVVDALITNFHLPQSTLLMLVSAFSGRERILAAYREAVEQKYRFFSYGDAMFLTRDDLAATDQVRTPAAGQ